MSKGKGLLLIGILGILMLTGVLSYGINATSKTKAHFTRDGYILSVDKSEEGSSLSVEYFSKNMAYRADYNQNLIFVNTLGQNVKYEDSYIFTHFTDGGLGAVCEGIMLDLGELDKGFLNLYYITPDSVLTKTKDGYSVMNGVNELQFNSIFWKISENKFMIAGGHPQVNLPNGDSRTVDSFMELGILSDGIIEYVTEEEVLHTIAAGASIEYPNGTKIDLETGLISTPGSKRCVNLDDIRIDTEDAIVIAKPIVLPEFHITSIDGEEGIRGVEGKTGMDGDKGETGMTGEAGANGTDGTIGSSGSNSSSGATGARGASGASGDEAVVAQRSEKIPSFIFSDLLAVTETTIEGSIIMESEDEDDILVHGNPSNMICLYNAETGALIAQCPVDYQTIMEQSFSFQDLNPNTRYRITLVHQYEMVRSGISGVKEFTSKIVYTDGIGLNMQIAKQETDSLTINVIKQTWSTANNFVLYYNKPGESALSTQVYLCTLENTFHINILGLEPDSEYEITLAADNGTSQNKLLIKTLKRKPEIEPQEGIKVLNNARGYFDVEFTGSVSDLDLGVISYEYDVYEVAGNGDLSYVTTVSNEKAKGLSIGIDDVIICRGKNYQLKGHFVFFDNAKNVVYELGTSNTFLMRENGIPVISFHSTEVRYEAITGSIRFDSTYCDIDISSLHPLIVDVYADGVYRNTLQFTDENIELTKSIPVDLKALKRNTEYAFSIKGYAKLNDTFYTQSSWGSFRVETGSPSRINVEMQEDREGTAAVNARLYIGDATTNTLEYKTLTCIEIQMQSQSGQVLGTSYLVLDENDAMYGSSISDAYWGTGNYISINENTFGLSAASLSGLQKVRFLVKAMYDYTYSADYRDNNINIASYINQLDFTEATSYVEVEKVKTPPALPTGAYMGVVAIQNMAVDAYKAGSTPSATLREDTIVGYSLTPHYSNDSFLAEVVHYYIYDAEEFRQFLTDHASTISTASSPDVRTGNITIAGNTLMPLQVYEYGTLGTKIDKVSLPKLNLFFGEGITTLEDETSLYNSSATRRVYSAYMGDQCTRGREYFFVYCVEWEREGTSSNYVYPYSHTNFDTTKRFEAPQLLQSTGVKVDGIQWKAYRQEPIFYFYPYTSGRMDITGHDGISEMNGMIWKYRIEDPDHALASYYDTDAYDLQAKSISTGGVVGNLIISGTGGHNKLQLSAEDHIDYESLKIGGLSEGQTAVLYKRQSLLYDNISTSIEQVSQVYDGDYNFSSTDFTVRFDRVMEGTEEKNQYNITITSTLPSNQSLDRVTMIGIRFLDSGNVPYEEGMTYLPITEYENNQIQVELPFSSFPNSLLNSIANNIGDTTVIPQVYVFYDTGREGTKVYEAERTPNLQFPTYPMALQMTTDGSVVKGSGQYQVIKKSAVGVMISNTGSTKPTNALLLGNSNITITGNNFFVTVTSPQNLLLSRTVGLQITPFGCEILSQDSETTGQFLMPKEINNVNVDLGEQAVLTIGGMRPTLNNMSVKPGLFSADIEFMLDSGSYAIIKKASTAGVTGATGNFFIRYWEKDNETCETTLEIPLSVTEKQNIVLNGLDKAKAYCYEVYYKSYGVKKEILDARTGTARIYNFITQNEVIVTIDSVGYTSDTYMNKSVTTQFRLSTYGGFHIAYLLTDLTLGVTYDSRDAESPLTALADPGNTESLISSYKLSAIPGSIFVYGHNYSIKILAYSRAGGEEAELGHAVYDFSIPLANEPAFIVRSVPAKMGNENRLTIYVVAADNSRTLVSRDTGMRETSEYCIRLTDMVTHQLVDLKANSSLATSTYGVSYDETRDLFFVDILTARSKAFTVRGLEEDRDYLLELFTTIDLQNTGGRNPIYTCPIPCVAGNMVKSQTVSTTNEYGIKVGSMRADISGSSITLRFNDSAYLDRITTVMYTITNLEDGSILPISAQIPKIGDDPLLIQNPTITSTYNIALPKPSSMVSDANYAITVALRIDTTTVATMTDTFWY